MYTVLSGRLAYSAVVLLSTAGSQSHIHSEASGRRFNHVRHIVSITAHQLREYDPSLNRSK